MRVGDLKGQKLALAASGGLDTRTIAKWLQLHGVKIIALIADLGQPDEPDLEVVAQRMIDCGCVDAKIIDAKQQIALAGLDVIQAQARYEWEYWNTTGIARHITVAVLLPVMRELGVKILAHGSTGRGNDQVRFELVTKMLASDIEVYAPWRDSLFLEECGGGRAAMIDWGEKHGLPTMHTKEKPYSTDANMLGLTHEAGELEYLTTPADLVVPEMGVWPENAPDEPELIKIAFESGTPIYIGNGNEYRLGSKNKNLYEIFKLANKIAGKYGVGIYHQLENRFVGIKSRGVYEAPGMELLGQCYKFLIQAIMDKRATVQFNHDSITYATQIYDGLWFDLTSQQLRGTFQKVRNMATGAVTVKLYKGNISFHSLEDVPYNLYSAENSSMEAIGDFDHRDSQGLLNILGLNAKALARAEQIDQNPIGK